MKLARLLLFIALWLVVQAFYEVHPIVNIVVSMTLGALSQMDL